jgi:cytochrome c-type biogenesis protein CcmH
VRGWRFARLALTAALVLLAASGPVVGQQAPAGEPVAPRVKGPSRDPALEAKVREVSAELRCPVCQGLSLQDSPSELSQEMRDVVREQLQSGKSPDEVKAYFVEKYGEWILLEPKARGFNLVVYLLPAVAVLAGGGVIALALRKWTASAPDSPLADAPEDAEAEEFSGRG